jgi:hypothetical protein
MEGAEHGYSPDIDIMELFQTKKCVKIAAPMVRCPARPLFAASSVLTRCSVPQVRFSKLPFRHVVRSYGTDIVYTPMIMADSFTASQKARDVELTTNT